MDSAECETETSAAFVDLANEMSSVATSMADRDDAQRLWNRCMGSRGYELVKTPSNEPAASPPAAQ